MTDASLSSGNQNESTAKTGSGRGWHGNAAGHAVAGRKGGSKVAQDREHMAEIGRRGGSKVAQDREHMAEIGQKGGKAKGSKES